jgi:hypothetical protein
MQLELALNAPKVRPPVYSIQIAPRESMADGTWALIAPKLALVREKCKATWNVGDIWTQINLRQAFAFLFYKDDEFVGVTIVRQDIDNYTGEKFCLSFASWFQDFDAMAEEIVQFYDDIARNMGVDLIRFESPREGWKGKKHGCKIAAIFWERRLG